MTRVVVYRCDEPECTELVDSPLPKTWISDRLSNGAGHRCPKHVLRECRKCKRMCRPQRFTLDQYPGTVRIGQDKELCVNCDRDAKPVNYLNGDQEKFIKRLIRTRLEDPDDRLLVLNQLGLAGDDID